MTFIYINTSDPERAVLAADTWSYSANGSSLGHSEKVHPFPTRRMAVVRQGDVMFGDAWVEAVRQMGDSTSLGLVNEYAPDLLRSLWAHMQKTFPGAVAPTLVLHVGYDDVEGRWTTTAFYSGSDFQPERVGPVFTHPTPVGYVMPKWERLRTTEGALQMLAEHDDTSKRRRIVENLRVLTEGDVPFPAYSKPEHVAAWANFVREGRAMLPQATGHKVLVGGELWLTEMTTEATNSCRVLTWDDPERVLAGTMHPTAQAAQCWCGSDLRWIDCHGVAHLDEPCSCGSGARFAACCAIERQRASVLAA